jgi:hypothetical protein
MVDLRRNRILIIAIVVLMCAVSSHAAFLRWINENGGMINDQDNWTPIAYPEGRDLYFSTRVADNFYTVYAVGDDNGLFRCGFVHIEDYVTLDLLGATVESNSLLSVGMYGGQGGGKHRDLTLTNNLTKRGVFSAREANISGLHVGQGVDVSIETDVTAFDAYMPIDLNITGGGRMTIGQDLLAETTFKDGVVRVSGPGSRLTVNGDIRFVKTGRPANYRIHVEDQGVFSVAGSAEGGSGAAGIHLENGILIADRILGRDIMGYGVVIQSHPGDEVPAECDIWIPMGQVKFSQDFTVAGRATFFSSKAAEISGLTVLGDNASITCLNDLKLIGGEILANPGHERRARIEGDLFVDNGVINVVTGRLDTDVTEGYGLVIGNGPVLQHINGTVSLDRLINIGSNDAVVYSLGAASLDGSTNLAGGTLSAPNGLKLGSDAIFLGYGQAAATVSAAPGSMIQTAGGTLILGDASRYDGFATAGYIVVRSGDVMELRSASFAALGQLTTLNFGTLRAPNGVVLGAGDNLIGTGAVECKIAAGLGSTIAATDILLLGDPNARDGFAANGSMTVASHVVTLFDADHAVLGSMTTIGGGELAAPNGLFLPEGNSISGSGLISADIKTNGHIHGAQPGMEMAGRITGLGHFSGEVEFSFFYGPGDSPTIAYHGNSTFTATSTLQIELGGLIAGSQFDKLIAETLSLDGTLQVVLIDGFAPQLGDTFDIFDFDALEAPRFDTISLPELTGRKTWDTSSLYTDGLIAVIAMRPGDTDDDRDVDGDDYHAFLATFGNAGDRWTDFDGNGRIDLNDFALLRANFGVASSGSPGGPGAATPEPTTLLLVAIGAPLIMKRRKRK